MDISSTDPEDYIRNCTHPTDNPCEVTGRDGVIAYCCCDCWNAYVKAFRARRRAERQAELTLENRCDRCGKRPWSWYVAGYKLCGYCKVAAVKEHRRNLAGGGPNMAGFNAILAGDRLIVDVSTWAINRPQQTSLGGA